MHRKQPIAILLYNYLYPHPRSNDPISFSAHLAKNLVPEVRIETATFYGSLDTIEARYPGLNYSYPPHRKRLGRFAHHANLFKAFDALALTEGEIAGFCRWEGTKWARERYERDEGIKVQDTTGLDIPEWVDPRKTKKARVETPAAAAAAAGVARNGNDGIHIKRETTVEIEQIGQGEGDAEMQDGEEHEDEEDGELEDAAEESTLDEPSQAQAGITGVFPATASDRDPLQNQNDFLRTATPTMQNHTHGMDLSVWEQWVKEATENGSLAQLSATEYAQQRGFLPSNLTATTSNHLPSTSNPRMGSPRA
ncbi:MAG: hypothetical protein M1821_001365 [Bathelium mastoideum]|nr:MAG: hypothetical protein M1821_001365 [Bathelium mastoideum]KAI9689890.1 MAG: hypothetical protein M1822_009772 [Bathelium mastoideum]